MAVARAKGHLKGKQPKLSELFNVSRATVYRELQRRRVAFLAACGVHVF